MVPGYQSERLCGFHDNEIIVHCLLQYYEYYEYYFVAVIILKNTLQQFNY